jgi:hypothetical protein
MNMVIERHLQARITPIGLESFNSFVENESNVVQWIAKPPGHTIKRTDQADLAGSQILTWNSNFFQCRINQKLHRLTPAFSAVFINQ